MLSSIRRMNCILGRHCATKTAERSVVSAVDLLSAFSQHSGTSPLPPDGNSKHPTVPSVKSSLRPATSMRERYDQFQRAYPSYIILMQVGDFFEFYGIEAAKQASHLLDLSVSKGGDMTGFPVRALDTYMARLLRAGKSVVVAEQFCAASGGGRMDRQVTRIVTPGTVTEENLLENAANNFLLCIVPAPDARDGSAIGMAWIDVSTGLLVVGECKREAFGSMLFRINPKEVLLAPALVEDKAIGTSIAAQGITASRAIDLTDADLLCSVFGDEQAIELTGGERLACNSLLRFVKDTQNGALPLLEPPVRQTDSRFMSIDAASFRALDITANSVSGDRKASLYGVLDHTATAMGARLLTMRLEMPSIERLVVENRLDMVGVFFQDEVLRRKVAAHLAQCYDMARALQRLSLNREVGGPRDLRHIGATLEQAMALKKDVEQTMFIHLPWGSHDSLARDLLTAIVDEGTPSRPSEGGVIAAGYSASLDEMRQRSVGLRGHIELLAVKLRQETGIERLRISSTPTQEYLIRIPRRDKPSLVANPAFWLESETEVEARFSTAELRQLNASHANAGVEILACELALYEELRLKVCAQARAIQRCANAIAEIDVALALAEAATSNGYVRPQLTEDTRFDVSHGRHPVIDCILGAKGDTFVTNSCSLAASPLAIITGPNMGGKSTFLRQNALLAVMAQSGSFVPAQSAAIGIVDAVFTRIGAADDLTRDRSTFMLEMEETASILRHATPRSLILMDEVGRGTAADEGLALAIGIAKRIQRIGCRCLFATHYTQLPQRLLLGEDNSSSSRVQCWRTSVAEDGEGGIVVIPRIVPGVSEQSFAIPIARLAGIPEDVLREAARQLEAIRSSPK